MVHLESFWQQYQNQGLTVLAVNIGQTGEVVATWADGKGITYHLALDVNADIYRLFTLGSFPFNAVIGRDGQLYHSGYGLNVNAIDDLIRQLLDETPVGESSWSAVKALF